MRAQDHHLRGWLQHGRNIPVGVNNTHGATTRHRVTESVWLNPAAVSRRAAADPQIEIPAPAQD